MKIYCHLLKMGKLEMAFDWIHHSLELGLFVVFCNQHLVIVYSGNTSHPQIILLPANILGSTIILKACNNFDGKFAEGRDILNVHKMEEKYQCKRLAVNCFRLNWMPLGEARKIMISASCSVQLSIKGVCNSQRIKMTPYSDLFQSNDFQKDFRTFTVVFLIFIFHYFI